MKRARIGAVVTVDDSEVCRRVSLPRAQIGMEMKRASIRGQIRSFRDSSRFRKQLITKWLRIPCTGSNSRRCLHTHSSGDKTARIFEFEATKRKSRRVVGDASNAYVHAQDKGKVCCKPPAEILNELAAAGKWNTSLDTSVDFGDFYSKELQEFGQCFPCDAFPSNVSE